MSGLQGKRWFFFVWDRENIEHLAEHGIKPSEAEQVFFNRYIIITPNKKKHGHRRYRIDGTTDSGRSLRLIFEDKEKNVAPNFYRVGFMKKMKQTRHLKRDYDPSEWDESQSVEVIPEKRKQASEFSTSIRLPKGMVSKLRSIAVKKGDIGYQTLIKIWLAERLEQEIKSKKGA